MDYFTGTKKQISPCIASKAKYALRLKNKKPTNIKMCCLDYWKKVVDNLSFQYNISDAIKTEAVNQFKFLV